MPVGAKVCDLTQDLLWFVCGLYVGILTSSLSSSYYAGLFSNGYVLCLHPFWPDTTFPFIKMFFETFLFCEIIMLLCQIQGS